ncbi:outer membrane protein [Aureimonas sp. AU12]|uniref:outer membrane protein n=1 Tax=Aureimonas sp. AU12 TaxID=1638161 RepID=UPI000783BFEB|nr:outer membrane protein [Aureimonas sp. AU12]
MKTLLLALAASTIAGSAFAADIVDYPPPEPPVVFVPAFSWTGAYVGAQAGGSFNDGSSNIPTSLIFVPGIAAIPGTPGRPAVPANPGNPAIPGNPGSPAIPANPGSPAIPGNPGSPGTPATPGSPAVFGTLEYSCTAAAAGGAGAGSCAVQYPNGTSGIISADELSATLAGTGEAIAFGVAREVSIVVTPAVPASPGTPAIPATPGTPAVPATPGSPAVPATEGTPAVPATPAIPAVAATPGTPGTPDATYAYDFGANTRVYSEDDDSFAGGVHVGYNHAFAPIGANTFVLGAIADLSYVDITKSAGITDGIQTIGVSQELDYLATLRLKAGVGLDRFLVYGTGGVAFGNVETTIINTVFDAATAKDDTRVGYAVGGGTDYALTDNVLLGLEYLYTNLGSDDDAKQVVPLRNGATLTTRPEGDFDFHTVWAKASYRFD